GLESRAATVQTASDAYHRRLFLVLRALDAARALAVEPSERAAHRAKLQAFDGAVEERLRYTVLTGALQTAGVAVAGLLLLAALGAAASGGAIAAADASSALCALWLMRGYLETAIGALPRLLEGVQCLRRVAGLLGTDEPEPYQGRSVHALQGGVELRRV